MSDPGSLDERAAAHDAQAVVAAMHALAIRTAMPHLRPADIAAMRAANRRFAEAMSLGDPTAALTADDELHGVLVDIAANQAAREVIAHYLPVLRRVERQRFASLSGRRSVGLHDRLIDACDLGDTDAALAVSDEIWAGLGLLIDLDLPDLPDDGDEDEDDSTTRDAARRR